MISDLIDKYILQDKNMYISGEAGTGKSWLLKRLTKILKKNSKPFVVLAPTGMAAMNVNGETIHKFCGLSPIPGYQILENLEKLKRPKKQKLIEKLQVLILDEVSMIRADMLDVLDIFFKINRNKHNQPFGGLQVVMFGDHFQLPPIVKHRESSYFQEVYNSSYFFSSRVYDSLSPAYIKLQHNYRQKDQNFLELLRIIRLGNIQKSELEYVNSLLNIQSSPNRDMLTIASRNAQVEATNTNKLDFLQGKEFVFQARIDGNFDPNSILTPTKLHLKVGARVMFVKNDIEKRWVNGSMGVVKEIKKTYIQVQFTSGKIVKVEPVTWSKMEYQFDVDEGAVIQSVTGAFIQFPLTLAWAVSIHKSQGQTYDSCYVDLGLRTFAPGQTYVALSRVRTLQNLLVSRSLKFFDVTVSPEVINFDESVNWNSTL